MKTITHISFISFLQHAAAVAMLAGIFVSTAGAQFKKGSTEISLLGGGGSFSYNEGSSSSSSITYISLALAPGYYVAEGLSIEPELAFTLLSGNNSSDANTGASFIGNLSYTFVSEQGRSAPYLRAGIGVSNGIQVPIYNGLIVEFKRGTVTVFNAGTGMKFLVGDHAAIRTEVAYKLQTISQNSRVYSYSNIGVQFGLSIMP